MEKMDNCKYVKRDTLIEIARESLMKVGCNRERAEVVADNLVEADMRGVSSHGVARLQRYLDHIQEGLIDPRTDPVIVHETPVSAVVDGNNGVGQYIARFATELAIHKAKESGIGMVTVRNSNHYGIAGYYAEMIMEQGMLGFSTTNTAPLVVPTFGKDALLGTNPVAIAFPTSGEMDSYMIDMATSVVPRGKLEVYGRNRKDMPMGWCVDETGHSTGDPNRVLENFKTNAGGGILALGGEGEEFGGHKGYGMALLVELLSAGLSQGTYSAETYREVGGICHFFAAVRLDLFGSPDDVTESVSVLLGKVKNSKKAEGADEIFLHGEKEYRMRRESLDRGVPVDLPTHAALGKIAEKYGIEAEL